MPTTEQDVALRAVLATLAPGTWLRDGLERILRGNTGALIVKADSPITSVKQLAGKKVAHSGIGTQAWAAVADVEMKNGVDPKSVQDLEMSYPQMPGVLAQGLVDAVAAVSPRVGLVLKADIRPGYDGQLTAKVERIEEVLRDAQ